MTVVVWLAWTAPAFADGGVHGGYTPTTDSCAGCHRAHTAQAPDLLKTNAVYGLCVSCHGGTGANTNVKDGMFLGAGGGSLRGGGFEHATMNTDFGATALTSKTTASVHAVAGLGAYASDTAWGMGAPNSGAGPAVVLECSSCHNPHGYSKVTDAVSGVKGIYRILKPMPILDLAAGGTVTSTAMVTLTDTLTKVYTISDTVGASYWRQPVPDVSDANNDNMRLAKLADWCGTCHARIHAIGSGTSNINTGDAIYAYRHSTEKISSSSGKPTLGCLSCHVAHGSSAAAVGFAGQVPEAGTAEGGGIYQDSALLRLDNRGVCQGCHNK